MRKIKSLSELKRLAADGGVEVAILLGHGLMSTKFVDYDSADKQWRIESHIDGSTTTRLSDTNIVKAIKKGALILTEVE